MHTARISEYRGHLTRYHQKVVEDRDPLRISGGGRDVVVMAALDYENLMENLYILKDKVTMHSLLNTRREKAQKTFEGIPKEEAFDDILDARRKPTGKRRSRLVQKK